MRLSETTLPPDVLAPAPLASRSKSSAPAQPRLVLERVSKRWRRASPPVLDNLDLKVEAGARTLVVGRNGSGKTTLLRIIAGLIAADGGVVRVDGLASSTQRREYQRRIGFLSAGSGGLYARLTVAQHLDYWARLALVPAPERRSRVEIAIERFELAPIASQRAQRLSMGQRQRLRMALAFLHGPSLVLLDEPLTSLDVQGIALVNETLTAFTAAGGSVVSCVPSGTDPDSQPADEIYVLARGELERV